MRTSVTVPSSGFELSGWFYEPEDRPSSGAPAVLMSHGISAVKEQGLDEFARAFCAAGMAVLVIDYRCLGSSSGAERGRIIPHEQHDDLRAGLSWLTQRDGVDADRIGLWGTSFSGGHSLYVGALDPRVKVVVVQVPAIDMAASLIALNGLDGFRWLLGVLADDHAARNAGQPGSSLPIVAPAGEPSVLPTADSYEFFTSHRAPTWVSTTSMESIASAAEYRPSMFIDLIAPRPLLIQAAAGDSLIPIDQVREAYARAGEPKRLDVHDCGHFDVYPGMPCHEQVLADATAWFTEHLMPADISA